MASISNDANGKKRILFVDPHGKRRTLWLGKTSLKTAETIKYRVELIVAALASGAPLDGDTARWLSTIGDDLAGKLQLVGLMAPRASATLASFCDAYIAGRSSAKPNTIRNLTTARRRLVECFGDKPLREFTHGHADNFFQWLKGKKYSNATISRTVRRAKQFFRSAVRHRLIDRNPFEDAKAPGERNESRKRYVPAADIFRVIEAASDVEWKLIIALARFAGLRTPSETLALKWVDIDWARNRMLVHSPKTEHHDGHEDRWIPIYDAVRPYLEAAWEAAAVGAEFVIAQHRGDNLRTQFLRFIKAAGLTPWPKLFVNLRASCAVDLAQQLPIHVVSRFMGHAAAISEKHYLQVLDSDFERASHFTSQSAAAGSSQQGTGGTNKREILRENRENAILAECVEREEMPLEGLEPSTL